MSYKQGFLSFVFHYATNADIREDFRSAPDATMAQFGLTADEMNAFKTSDEAKIANFIKEDFKSKVDIVTPY